MTGRKTDDEIEAERVEALAHELTHEAANDAARTAGAPSPAALRLEAFARELMKSPPGAALRGPAVDLARGSTDGEPVRASEDIDTGRLLAMTRAELVARIEAAGRQHLEPAVIERLTDAELRARLHARRRRQTE